MSLTPRLANAWKRFKQCFASDRPLVRIDRNARPELRLYREDDGGPDETIRHVVQHLHIFKNAGSSVDFGLQRSFGRHFLAYDGPHGTVLTTEQIQKVLEARPHVLALTSHQARFPVVATPAIHVLPMVFIRHPLDRAGSVYSFHRRQPPQARNAEHVRGMSLADYVRWRLTPGNGQVICNFQVMYLSDLNDLKNARLVANDLRVARSRLHDCTVVGVVDRFDESMTVAEHVLAPYYPGIDLSYVRQNVSHDRAGCVNDKIADIARRLGDDLFDQLVNANQLDLDLYDLANAELDQRRAVIPDFDQQLVAYTHRCQRHALAA